MSTSYDIAIVGAGIVGSSLAAALAPHARVLLVDRDVRGLPGSTGHAPGFVGQLNCVLPLTELAKRSVQAYRGIEGGFDVVGGLEVALSTTELEELEHRRALAESSGLRASLLSPEEAVAIAPDFVAESAGALHFPDDGTANARVLALAFQDRARQAGAAALDADVSAVTPSSGGVTLTTSRGEFKAAKAAICTGVWAAQLAPALMAAVTVAHPYAYSHARAPRGYTSPFVRWPSRHVYARDHGRRDGLGSYDHDPVHVSSRAMARHRTATGAWDEMFDGVIQRGLALLPSASHGGFADPVVADAGSAAEGGERAAQAYETAENAKAEGRAYAFNGLFQVTPDGMPLVGRVQDGVYVAVGVWVTQGAGAAGLLADLILEDMGRGPAKDVELRKAVDPLRFAGGEGEIEAALRTYNNIYNKDE